MFKWLWERYFFTGIFILWAMVLFTLVTLKVFGLIGEVPEIPAATATAFGTLFGAQFILEIVKWRSTVKKDKDKDNVK